MVTIRIATPHDAAALLAIYEPFILNTPVTFEEAVPSVDAFAGRIVSTIEKYPWLVCTIDGLIAGYAYATDHRERASYRWTKEVSVYIHHDFRRRRIAHALYTVLLDILRLQGVTNVLAGITVPNAGSVGFHESFGFTKVGIYKAIGYKLNAWHDVGWWELRLDDAYDTPLHQLKNVQDIKSTPGWASAIAKGIRMVKE